MPKIAATVPIPVISDYEALFRDYKDLATILRFNAKETGIDFALSETDWENIEASYGHKLPAELRKNINDLTHTFVFFAGSEFAAVTVRSARKQIEKIKKIAEKPGVLLEHLMAPIIDACDDALVKLDDPKNNGPPKGMMWQVWVRRIGEVLNERIMSIDYERFLEKLRGGQETLPAVPSEQQQTATPKSNFPPDNPDGKSGDKSELSVKLESVTERAIDKTEEILRLELPDPDHASFGAVLRAQNAAANTVLNTQVKVDENRLRKQEIDTLPQLLADIAEYERTNRFTAIETQTMQEIEADREFERDQRLSGVISGDEDGS